VALCGIVVGCVLAPGTAVLVALGLGVSAGHLVAAWHLGHRFRAALPPGGERLGPSLRRTLVGSVLAAGPAYLVAAQVPDPRGIVAACVIGVLLYAGLAGLWGSPELRSVVGRR
jgi:hypothetical protein